MANDAILVTLEATSGGRILVADDNGQLLTVTRVLLEKSGYLVDTAADGEAAVELAGRSVYDLLILDLRLPPTDGLQVLSQVKRLSPRTVVVLMTAHASVDTAVKALKGGALDYLVKPVPQKALLALARRAMELKAMGAQRRAAQEQLAAEVRKNQELQAELRSQYAREHLLGTSPGLRSIHAVIREVASTDSTVLILGESGTGKGLVARAIHYSGARADRPFVVANCTVYTEGVLQSELFGHERGAFTGAIREKPGRFELAQDGSIFLDEIGDLPASTQALLLRVLQERRFERVGGEVPLEMRARVIAATHRDLRQRIAEGAFRDDLFYRLNVIPVRVPPLRERVEDIPILAASFLQRTGERLGKQVDGFSPAAMDALCSYQWPGNVREVENAVERALVLAKGDLIQRSDLPAEVRRQEGTAGPGPDLSLHEAERLHVLRVLDAHGWNKKRSAEVLGINRSSLYNKLKRWGVEIPATPEPVHDTPG